MDKVQAALNEYFSSKGFFKNAMDLNFLFYGGGLLFMVIGSFFYFVGNQLFASIGLLAFLFGIVLSLAKKDTIGLIISFGVFALMYAVLMVIDFVRIFDFKNAAFLVNFFSDIIMGGVSVLFLLLSILKLPAYQAYRQQKIAAKAAAAQAAAAQAAAAAAYAAAHPQPAYTPPAYTPPPSAAPASVCVSCGFPLTPDAVFCPKCGSKQEKPEKKVCANCGTGLSGDAAFCVKCGTKL